MIELQRFEDRDIDRLLGWIGSEERALVQWAGPVFRHPLDRAQLEAHLATAREPGADRRVFKAVEAKSGRVVGHAELTVIDETEKSARISRMLVGERSRRGQGLGEQILRAVLRVAFVELGLLHVTLGVYDFNHAAIRCYEKLGFRREATRHEAVRVGGESWTSIQMKLSAEDRSREAEALRADLAESVGCLSLQPDRGAGRIGSCPQQAPAGSSWPASPKRRSST